MSQTMNRSTSNPADDASFNCIEEMKELFMDPALRKMKDVETKKGRSRCSSNLSSSLKIEPSLASVEENVKVVDPTFSTAGSHLMTRRITIAGGFLDIALFTANCEQLKFVLELGYFDIYYKHVLGLLITSLVLQLLVGLTMFLLGCQVIKSASDETYSNFLNHTTMGLVALITIVNIFISTFGPKGTVMARCLGAFAYPNTSGPMWMSYLNATRNYMIKGVI
ncbi:Ninjurin-2, partial [Stegodyphus mimosarum]